MARYVNACLPSVVTPISIAHNMSAILSSYCAPILRTLGLEISFSSVHRFGVAIKVVEIDGLPSGKSDTIVIMSVVLSVF